MSTGNYELQINWPGGHHSSAGTITDEQWGEIARILSPDHHAHDLNMVDRPVPEVVGYVSQHDLDWQGDCTLRKTQMYDCSIPVMTVAQHQRITVAMAAELGEMRNWKEEEMRVMSPVLDYAHSAYTGALGGSVMDWLVADHKRIAAELAAIKRLDEV